MTDARPRRPPHPHARLGRDRRDRRDPRPRRARRPTSTSSRSPTTSGSTPRSPPGRSPATAACRVEVVVGEEVTTRGGHLLGLFIDRARQAASSLRSTIAAIHDQGGLAIPAHPLVPYPLCAQGWVLRRLARRRRPALPPGRARGVQPDDARPAVARPRRPASPTEHGLPTVGNSDAHAADGDRHGLDDVPGPRRRRPPRGDPRRARPTTTARSTGPASQLGTFGQQLRKYGRDARDERRAAGSAATAPGATSATRAAATGRRASEALAADGRAPERDHGWAGVKIGLVSPYVYPLPGGVTQHVRLPLREPPPARPRRPDPDLAATASSGPRRATSSGSARASRCRPTARSGRSPSRPGSSPRSGTCSSASSSTCSTSTSRSCRSSRRSSSASRRA